MYGLISQGPEISCRRQGGSRFTAALSRLRLSLDSRRLGRPRCTRTADGRECGELYGERESRHTSEDRAQRSVESRTTCRAETGDRSAVRRARRPQ